MSDTGSWPEESRPCGAGRSCSSGGGRRRNAANKEELVRRLGRIARGPRRGPIAPRGETGLDLDGAPAPGGSVRTGATRPPATKSARAGPARARARARTARRARSPSSRAAARSRPRAPRPVTEPRGLLELEAVREVGDPRAERSAARCAGRSSSPALRAPRGELRGRCGCIGPSGDGTRERRPRPRAAAGRRSARAAAARVRRRAQLADQPHLLERRLELGAEHAPLDPLDGAERGLDRGPLPLASGSTSAAGPAGRAPCRRRAPGRAGRGRGRRRAAGARRARAAACRRRAACAARRALEVGERPRAALLGEPDQPSEDLRGRLRVGQRAVAGPRRGAEEERERGEARARTRPLEQAARERGRCRARARRCGGRSALEPRSRKDMSKRALCATSGASPAKGAKRRTAASRRRRAAELPSRPARSARRRRPAAGRPGGRATGTRPRARSLGADGADLADPGRRGGEPRRLQVDDDEAGLLEQRLDAGPSRERDGVPAPGDAASPATISPSRLRASARRLPSANRWRAASPAGTGPPRSSSSSTSRSAASSRSCSSEAYTNICSTATRRSPDTSRARRLGCRRSNGKAVLTSFAATNVWKNAARAGASGSSAPRQRNARPGGTT